jgi:hypothetical protein
MDKYRRVEKTRVPEDAAPADPNEVRITQQGKVRAYISYASGLLAVSSISSGTVCRGGGCLVLTPEAAWQQEKERAVVLKAMGHAISKAVTVAEVLKHRVAGLHQLTQLSSIETVDVFEPLEEGLDRVESKRHIPGICIRLSLDPLDESDPGYQAPLPASQVSPPLVSTRGHREGGGELKPSRHLRGKRSDGQQQDDEANTDEEAAVADQEPDDGQVEERAVATVGRARGSRRGRGGRGRGRGRGRVRGGRGSGEAMDGDSLADSTDRGVNDLLITSAAPADSTDAVAVPSTAAASGKKSSRGRWSGKKKKVPAGDGATSKDRDADGDGNNEGREESARDGSRSRGRGGRGRGRDRGARREPKTSSEVTEGPAAAAAD